MPTNSKIQIRKGLASEWISVNPILDLGEPGFDITNGILKIGDGVTPWNELFDLGNRYIRGSFVLDQASESFTINNGYTIGSLDIFLNGVKLLANQDYTASDGTSFVLSQAAPSGSVIEYLSPNPVLSFNIIDGGGVI
jgi:hypothetical protein